MTLSLDKLRRAAKRLRNEFDDGSIKAASRVAAVFPSASALKHADALHVLARENDFASWPALKLAFEAETLNRAERTERLASALYSGQHQVVPRLLAEDPDLKRENFGLACALYDIEVVRERLQSDPVVAVRPIGDRSPILHLTFSQHIHGGGRASDMLAVADALVAAGADVNESYPFEPGSEHELSALYGALGHANNMVLARWLLEHGADPDDNESLYHATELGHNEGLKLLLAHNASPEGTNALPRALDFDDLEAVRLLLEAGADPNEGIVRHPSGEPSGLVPALHQAARRMCSDKVVQLLLDHGADLHAPYQGHTSYALARVYGNHRAAVILKNAGAATALTPVEDQFARAADGIGKDRDWIDMGLLSDELRRLLTRLVGRAETLPHIRRLVAMGFDANLPDEMGMPPLHIAGWEGLPEVMDFFLRQQPDMGHVNGYGGTLFSTILHGSENCPHRTERDHIACMRVALEHGVALPRRALEVAANEPMADFLADWAEARPGQVVDTGAV